MSYILSRWTEYCLELYDHESYGDNAVLDCNQPPENLQLMLCEEVEITVAALKRGKSARVDYIPAEHSSCGEYVIDILTVILIRFGEQENGLAHGLSH